MVHTAVLGNIPFHPVLHNADLLSEIFRGQDNSTLARSARCCKAWEEPVLSVLWYSLGCIIPLLKILPVEVDETDGHYYLRKDVSKDDLARFKRYARLVRRLLFNDTVVQASFAFRLQQLASGEVLFPSLRDLRIYIEIPRLSHGALLFLSPSITKLLISDEGSHEGDAELFESHVEVFLDALGALPGQALEELVFTFPCNIRLSSIDHFTNLRCLSLHTFPFSGEKKIFSRLQYLTRLVSLTFDTDGLQSEEIVPEISLAALEKVKISGETSNVTRVLHAIDAPRLADLELDLETSTMAVTQSCCVEANARFGLSLREVTLCCQISGLDDHSSTSTSPLITPFLAIDNLESFSLIVRKENRNSSLSTIDDLCEAVVKAWPRLRAISIDHGHLKPSNPAPTFHSLIYFALHCPSLQSLTIPLCVSYFPQPEEVPLLSHNLRQFEFSPVGDLEYLVEFAYLLKRLFPYTEVSSY
ncbi:hypothetical protein JAAARDRAFT_74312 [Jaapia argillacea MUCL 33604]|uniref:F-box domain-containing protein n=1 Tax=Jaapia argillacea MUCL 33604 TaxID=933084 RepID=A0A067P8T9_9AGAM|nr:hypothetical protein JAAARDRAFT_74312 [Jaapia argillacea MUCL 33604]